MGANVTSQRGPQRARNAVVAALLVAVAAMTIAPTGFGLSSGITTETTPALDPEHGGCTACHGGGAFASSAGDVVEIDITDASGEPLAGAYHGGDTYTITITLNEQITGGSNAAGFNLFVDVGTLAPGDGSVQVSSSGQEATHTNGASTVWPVQWTAPEEGSATFRLFVNDVDGDGAPSGGDEVHLRVFSILDENYAMPGAVVEHEPHVGVPLPQYWLGLIALATMTAVILFAYLYLKYSNPHNANQKDR